MSALDANHTPPDTLAGQSLWAPVPPPPTLDPLEIERAITRVRGVQAARVEVGPGRQVHKVHAIAEADRDPKQLVRDIESLLYAMFRLRIDYRKISLVQVGEGQSAHSLARVRLIEAACEAEPAPVVRVTLRLGGKTVVGDAGLPEGLAETFETLRAQVDTAEQLAKAAGDMRDSLTAFADQTLYSDAPHLAVEAAAAAPLIAVNDPDEGDDPAHHDRIAFPPEEGLTATLRGVEARIDTIQRLGDVAGDLREQMQVLARQTLDRYLFPLGAVATVRAADEISGRSSGARPLAVQLIQIGDDRAVVITLDVPRGRGEHRVAGCALLPEGTAMLDAICRATLDALNRHLVVSLPSGD